MKTYKGASDPGAVTEKIVSTPKGLLTFNQKPSFTLSGIKVLLKVILHRKYCNKKYFTLCYFVLNKFKTGSGLVSVPKFLLGQQ